MAKKNKNNENAPAAEKTREPLNAGDYLARGILIGGAVGAFGALFGFGRGLFYNIGLGMIGGFLAGLTMAVRMNKRKPRQ